MGLSLVSPKLQFFDLNGDPLAGGKLLTKEVGGGADKITYSDSGFGAENTNPVILNARGECSVFAHGGESFWLRLTDADDVTIWTFDFVEIASEGTPSTLTVRYQSVTASAGQTVVSTTYAYHTGTHQLWVFVNGELQEATVDYIETNSNTITFVVPLIEGDKILLLTGGIFDVTLAHPVARRSEHILADGQTDVTVSFTYVPDNNEIQVYKNGALLRTGDYTELNSTTIQLLQAGQAGEELIIIYGQSFDPIQPTVATVFPRTPAEITAGISPVNITYPQGNVRRYGAVGNGSTNDRSAVQSAINVGSTVIVPDGLTYFLGVASTPSVLSVANNGQTFIFEGGAKLKANGVDGLFNTSAIIGIDGKSDIVLINPSFESNWGRDADRDVPHAVGLLCATGNTRHVTIINPKAHLCQTLVQAAKENHNVDYEVEDVEIVNGEADNCYYGTGWAYTGNNVRGSYRTLNAHRSYIVYCCHGHDLKVTDHHDGTLSSPTSFLHQVLIIASSFSGSIAAKDTYNIRLNYAVTGAQYTGIPFVLSVGHDAAHTRKGTLHDIHVTYNDRGSSISKSIGFQYYLDGVPTGSYTGTGLDRITIDGYAKNPFDLTNAGAIGAPLVQTVPGTLDLGGLKMDAVPTGVNNPHNGTLFSAGRVVNEAEFINFTPTALTSVAGTGTYITRIGRAWKRGKVVNFQIDIGWSAHTGTGNLSIGGLPFTSLNLANHYAVVNLCTDVFTFSDHLRGLIYPNTTVITLVSQASNASLAAVAIDTTATLYITGSYETN